MGKTIKVEEKEWKEIMQKRLDWSLKNNAQVVERLFKELKEKG